MTHLIDGEFQSDKYSTCPRGKVPLSVRDETAQDLLWAYAQRRRPVDAEFSSDLETALLAAGYRPPESRIGANATDGDLAALTAVDEVDGEVSARIAHLRAMDVDLRLLASEAHLDREVARIASTSRDRVLLEVARRAADNAVQHKPDMIGGGPALQIAYLKKLLGPSTVADLDDLKNDDRRGTGAVMAPANVIRLNTLTERARRIGCAIDAGPNEYTRRISCAIDFSRGLPRAVTCGDCVRFIVCPVLPKELECGGDWDASSQYIEFAIQSDSMVLDATERVIERIEREHAAGALLDRSTR